MKIKLDKKVWLVDVTDDDVIVTGSDLRAKDFESMADADIALKNARIISGAFENAEIQEDFI